MTTSTTRSAEPSAASATSSLPAVGAAAVTLLLWASAFVAIRHLGHRVPPGALSLARLLVGAVVLGVFVVRRTPTWPARRDWPLLLLCGICWFGIYNLTLNAAERRIDAGTSALVVQIGPIIVALLATVFLGERLTRWLVIGMVIGFLGVVVIARGSSNTRGDLLGVLLALTTFLVPFIATALAWLLLDEVPGALAFVGGALCIAGVLLTRRKPRVRTRVA